MLLLKKIELNTFLMFIKSPTTFSPDKYFYRC